jgi:hypothetical protein
MVPRPVYQNVMSHDTTADDAPTATTADPVRTANGHEVRPSPARDDTTVARRFAAAIGRDAPVDRVVQEHDLVHVQSVTVWIDRDVADGGAAIRAPDGWEQTRTFVTSNGAVCVTFERDPRGGD